MLKEKLASLLWEHKIIDVNFLEPVTFKSGYRSPIYCDLRKIQAHPELRSLIAAQLSEMISPDVDGIIGVATGALSHSSIVGHALNLPIGYVRPESKPKDHGLKKLIEGMDVSGKNIVIIEDLVSTAGSLIDNAKIVSLHNAKRVELLSIFSYDMEISKRELQAAGYPYRSLLTIHDLMPLLHEELSVENYYLLDNWITGPEGWFDRHKATFNLGFLTTLRQQDHSLVCMGIDPVIEALPSEYARDGIVGATHFFIDLIDEMRAKDLYPGMFKLNDGFYARHENGYAALTRLLRTLSQADEMGFGTLHPPIIADAKRGDIGKSSQNYADQFLGDPTQWSGITVAPYMGGDSIMPFANYCNKIAAKGVYILNKTSNSGAMDFQMAKMADGRYLYQHVTDKIIAWANGRPGVGAVVGGNSLEELAVIMKAYAGKNIPLLIPGVGAQGGSAKDVANVARETNFELSLMRINSSSGLTHPWYKKPGDPIPSASECFEMCINELQKLNEAIDYNGAV